MSRQGHKQTNQVKQEALRISWNFIHDTKAVEDGCGKYFVFFFLIYNTNL